MIFSQVMEYVCVCVNVCVLERESDRGDGLQWSCQGLPAQQGL